jgi:hypothetical protein
LRASQDDLKGQLLPRVQADLFRVGLLVGRTPCTCISSTLQCGLEIVFK